RPEERVGKSLPEELRDWIAQVLGAGVKAGFLKEQGRKALGLPKRSELIPDSLGPIVKQCALELDRRLRWLVRMRVVATIAFIALFSTTVLAILSSSNVMNDL